MSGYDCQNKYVFSFLQNTVNDEADVMPSRRLCYNSPVSELPGDVLQVFKDLFGDMLYNEGFSLRPVLLHPQTRGIVRLRSSDPTEQPFIEPNYLAHPDDIKILMEGMKYGRVRFA